MLTLDEMQEIAQNQNVIFYKRACPFCAASEKLFGDLLERGIVEDFKMYYLHEDFTDEHLTELVERFGWKAGSQYQNNCTKPQIFLKGEYIGGNFEFYKSRWNLGDENTGFIEISGQKKETPKLTNPMRF